MLLLVVLVMGVGQAWAQPVAEAPLLLKRLPSTGLVVGKWWRYHPGDKLSWASPAYNDRAWSRLDPSQDLDQLPAQVQDARRGWLRVRLQAGAEWSPRLLMVLVDQSVASEWYWDGRRIQHWGLLSPEGEVHAFTTPWQPVALPLDDHQPHLLAVRFALPAFAAQVNGGRLPPLFSLRIVGPTQLAAVLHETATEQHKFMVILGVLLLLTLLHLVLFAYTPERRANLSFALATACNAGLAYSFAFHGNRAVSVELYLAGAIAHEWVLLLGLLLALRALYAAFDVSLGRAYHALAWLALGVELVYLRAWHWGSLYSLPVYIMMLLLTADQLRVSWHAWRRGTRGAGIVVVGFVISVLTVLLAMATETGLLAIWQLPVPPLLGLFTRQFYLVGPAAALSFYLAREAALDRQLLQVKLAQVRELSAQAAAQQQEKQLLLAERNQDLEEQVAHRTAALQHSLHQLRSTQAQLIEHEKLASLGALTAGIAHEIQNPLNFVTNFAEVSAELVAELQAAHATGNAEDAEALTDDVAQNLVKIHLHGQRAAGIIRGMLDHARTSTGERIPTDLNALSDESLRLAYQSLRAKDPSFTADLLTDLTPALPRVEVVGADVGRVLLNLCTNAFYAVQQRQQQAEVGYRPIVAVRTRLLPAHVVVEVCDNGTGMPDSVKDKVFQPFFTTKPAGQGTGLGLSLSYDIVAQGHGGTLTVESQEGQGTTFTMTLALTREKPMA